VLFRDREPLCVRVCARGQVLNSMVQVCDVHHLLCSLYCENGIFEEVSVWSMFGATSFQPTVFLSVKYVCAPTFALRMSILSSNLSLILSSKLSLSFVWLRRTPSIVPAQGHEPIHRSTTAQHYSGVFCLYVQQ